MRSAWARNLFFGLVLLHVSQCTTSEPRNLRSERAIAELRPLLNSERIENRFGSYGVEVLYQDREKRISNLYSGEEAEERVTRTVAVVSLIDPLDPALRPGHDQIVAGASIGATFKNAGWDVEKTKTELMQSELPKSLAVLLDYRSRKALENRALATLRYRLDVRRENLVIPYAWITERYHPHYLTEADLEALYPDA